MRPCFFLMRLRKATIVRSPQNGNSCTLNLSIIIIGSHYEEYTERCRRRSPNWLYGYQRGAIIISSQVPCLNFFFFRYFDRYLERFWRKEPGIYILRYISCPFYVLQWLVRDGGFQENREIVRFAPPFLERFSLAGYPNDNKSSGVIVRKLTPPLCQARVIGVLCSLVPGTS